MKVSGAFSGRGSIMVKLALIFTVLIVISASLIAGLNLWIIFNRFETDIKTGCAHSLKNARVLIVEHAKRAENIAEFLAGAEEVERNLNGGRLQEYLDGRQDIWFSAIVEIYDGQGNLAARSYAPGERTESFFTPPGDPLIHAALDLARSSDFHITPGGLAIKAAAPVVNMATLESKGAVVVTLPFNIRFLRLLKEWVQAELILAGHGAAGLDQQAAPARGPRIISTLQDESGAPLMRERGKGAFDFSVMSGGAPRIEKIGGIRFITAYMPLTSRNGDIMGFLGAAVNTGVIEKAWKESMIIILIALMAVCVLAGLTAAITARSFTRPIRKLASAIHAMARGDLDQKVHLKQQDEIGDLARDLNHMGSQLQLYIQRTVEARADSRAKSEFLDNMSHEIRTPLNAVMGLSDLLSKTRLDPKQRNYLKKIQGGAFVLSGIINDILDFSRLEAGKMETEETPFQLSAMLDNLREMFESRASEKGIGLTAITEPGLPDRLIGDSARIQQVIMNLMSNALKFSSQGRIRIHVETYPDMETGTGTDDRIKLRFSVHDNGIGVDEEKMSELFRPFCQIDNSTTRRYGGTGLGLHICKQLVELMGGEIWAQSKPGEGSAFFFTVALKPDDGSAEMELDRPQPDDNEAHLTGARILLVEDNAINRLVAEEILEKSGVIVEYAQNGQEAVYALQQQSFDAVLMDIQMPVMDGYTAVKKIREMTPGAGSNFGGPFHRRDVPVIAMTAHAMNGDREKCLEAGMNDYIAKPIDPNKLFQTLRKWVAPSSARPSPPAPETAVKTAPAPASLPIHLDSAINRINGNKPLLIKLLTTFSSKYHEFPRLVAAAIERKDFERAVALSHEIKGVAANLSAETLREAAELLERILKKNPVHSESALEDQLQAFTGELETLLESIPHITDCLTDSDPPPPAAGEAEPHLKPDLDQLGKYIDAHSPLAEKYVIRLKNRISDPELLKKCEQLESELEFFNFKAAGTHFREIAEYASRKKII